VPESGNDLLKGQYSITLDEKGRIVFPSRLRSGLAEPVVMITHGMDKCLWIFSSAEWRSFAAKITESTSQLNMRNLAIRRNFTAPAQEVEFDRNGRLSIPQSLRDYAGLSKDCVIHSMKSQMIELWDAGEYQAYLERSEAIVREAMENVSIDF
jgi:MraZ protein